MPIQSTSSSTTPFPTSADAPTVNDATAAAATAANDAAQRAADKAHATIDRVAQKAGPVVERVKTQIDSAYSSLQDRAGQLTSLQQEWTETARTHVRANPLQSVGIALAVGWLVGRLAAR